jgi:hypothetical protein
MPQRTPAAGMEICSRCDGHGVISHYAHIERGVCFACGGTGVTASKSSATQYRPVDAATTWRCKPIQLAEGPWYVCRDSQWVSRDDFWLVHQKWYTGAAREPVYGISFRVRSGRAVVDVGHAPDTLLTFGHICDRRSMRPTVGMTIGRIGASGIRSSAGLSTA